MEHNSNEKSLPHYLGFDQLPINGKWRHGKGAKVLRDFNPYSGELIVEIPHASRDDMDVTVVNRKLMEDRVSEAYMGLKNEYHRLLSNKCETETENCSEANPMSFGSIKTRSSSAETDAGNGRNL